MLMKKLICFFNLCLLLVSCGHKSQVSLVSLVNPLMGTESTFEFSHGNTYLAVAVPVSYTHLTLPTTPYV